MSPQRRTRGLRCCRKLVATAAPPTGATKYSATLCEIACSITCRCQGVGVRRRRVALAGALELCRQGWG